MILCVLRGLVSSPSVFVSFPWKPGKKKKKKLEKKFNNSLHTSDGT